MNVLFILIFSLSWFESDFLKAKKMYFKALRLEKDTTNPFIYFQQALEYEKGGNLIEAKRNLEKAKIFSNKEPSILFLMYIISDRNNLPDFKNEIWNELLKSKEKKGVKEIPEISYYFLDKSRKEILLSSKISELNKALKISPSFYPAWYEKLKIYYLNLKFIDFFKTLFDLKVFFTENPVNKKIFLITILRSALIIFFSIFLILFFSFTVKKRFSVYFLFGEKLPKILEMEYLYSILFIALILIGTPLPFYMILLFPIVSFLDKKEKNALAFSILMIFILIVVGTIYEKKLILFLENKNNPEVLLYLTKNSPYDEDLIKKWDTYDSPESKLMKGIIYLKGNKIEKAKKIFKELLNSKNVSYELYVNLGNLYFLENKFDSASFFYRKAIEINPDRFEAHFNLAQVAFLLVDLDLFQKEIDIANEIDHEQTTYITSRIKEYKLTPVINSYPEKITYEFSNDKKVFLFTENYFSPYLFVPLSIIILFLIFYRRREKNILRCKSCLRLIPFGGFEVEPVGIVCESCKSELLSTSSLKLRQRLSVRLKMKRLDRIRTGIFIANTFLPGLGFAINTSYFLFLFTSLIFSASLLVILFTSFKFIGIILYILSMLFGIFYYLTGGKVDASL